MIDTLLCIQKIFQKPVDILPQVAIIVSVKVNRLEKRIHEGGVLNALGSY